MKENYDFSKGVKNPYKDKLKNGYTVTVHYDFTKKEETFKDTDKKNDIDNNLKKQA